MRETQFTLLLFINYCIIRITTVNVLLPTLEHTYTPNSVLSFRGLKPIHRAVNGKTHSAEHLQSPFNRLPHHPPI